MVEVSKNVFVGDDNAALYGWIRSDNWIFVHCAKERWHREAVGYIGRGCPKDHKEYLYAIRDNSISLNMIDVDNPNFFSIEMIKAAIGFAVAHEDKRILFNCNQGMSRGPSMAMLYLAVIGKIDNREFALAEKAFKKLYPDYQPRNGIREHLRIHWDEYTKI